MNRFIGPTLDEQCFEYPFAPEGDDPREHALQGLQDLEDPQRDGGTLILHDPLAAEAARAMFPCLAVITCHQSAGSLETWAPLAGRGDLVLWPSHDRVGKLFAKAVHRCLEAHSTPLHLVDVPAEWPAGWNLGHRPPEGVFPDDLLGMINGALTAAAGLNFEEPRTERRLRDFTLLGPELARMVIPQRELLVDPWMTTSSITMVFAARGVGKTWWASELARALTAGGPFFDWYVPQLRRVLYIDGEMTVGMLQERFQFLFGGDPPDRLALLPSETLWTKDRPLNLCTAADQFRVQELLDDMGKEGKRPDLIIFDNLSSLTSGMDENDNSAQDALLGWFTGLRHQGFAVLQVHHAGKGGDQRGASRREDPLDNSIKLTALDMDGEGASFNIEFTKARGCKRTPLPVGFNLGTAQDGKTAKWTKVKTMPAYIRALFFIRDNSPKTVKELGALMGITRQGAQKHIDTLREKGLIREVDMGISDKGTKAISRFEQHEAA